MISGYKFGRKYYVVSTGLWQITFIIVTFILKKKQQPANHIVVLNITHVSQENETSICFSLVLFIMITMITSYSEKMPVFLHLFHQLHFDLNVWML